MKLLNIREAWEAGYRGASCRCCMFIHEYVDGLADDEPHFKCLAVSSELTAPETDLDCWCGLFLGEEDSLFKRGADEDIFKDFTNGDDDL